jgi:hypothetical protein
MGADDYAMDSFDGDTPADSLRWNDGFRVSPVQFEREEKGIARGVRLCCPAARPGDPDVTQATSVGRTASE